MTEAARTAYRVSFHGRRILVSNVTYEELTKIMIALLPPGDSDTQVVIEVVDSLIHVDLDKPHG